MGVGVPGASRLRVRRPLPASTLTTVGWVAGAALTGLVVGTPYVVFGYRNPSLHLVLGSVDACVASLVAYLVYGRYLRRRRLQDLLLADGLAVLAVAGFGLTLLLHLLDAPGAGLEVWLPVALRTLGGVLLVASALVGREAVVPARRRIVWLPWVVALGLGVVLWLLRAGLPAAVEDPAPASPQHVVLTGHPLLLVAQSVAAVCFMVASLAFTRQAVRHNDELVRWLGPALALGAFARVHYVLFPSLYSDWLYTGDLLRTGSYLLLLVGAGREIEQYWSAQTRAAVLEDRRRLARELHDGVVQELGYIRAETMLTADSEGSARVVAACDRALDEARAAVDALGRSGDEPLGFVLHRAAQQVAERYAASLDVDLDHSVVADTDERHALVRITREAVSNAIRHGGAERVCLRLVRDQARRRLVVVDDGRGFDAAAVVGSATGFGLTSMRERALALPGTFEIRSAPGEGTTVEVTW